MDTVAKNILKVFIDISKTDENLIRYKYSPVPHEPYPLPKNSSAVYVFICGSHCLKVGKAGPKSKARFNSHHYYFSTTKSSLAKSIILHKNVLKEALENSSNDIIDNLNAENIREWLLNNTSRLDFMFSSTDKYLLNLLESYVQYKFHPLYEDKIVYETGEVLGLPKNIWLEN